MKYGKNQNTILSIKKLINKKLDTTYSPLALYFLIDNNLIENTKKEINNLFDILIKETKLREREIKNLINI